MRTSLKIAGAAAAAGLCFAAACMSPDAGQSTAARSAPTAPNAECQGDPARPKASPGRGVPSDTDRCR